MAEVLKKFGRYFLLDHLAQGGMAEIYRARLAAPDGAGRLMVIKRIQAGFGTNAEFLQMFKSEIKVTMGFNHPNIVQLYDFGEEQSQPYIAMELVDGKNLKQFVARTTELRQPFPIELAVFIAEQAASGLHYAHSFRDKISGTPLNIVHRDISPQNILISYEGNVKVIDFGIAKATTNMEATRAGVIKGKPSYLSPEQISGESLDGRSDIFAMGAVLWECLTGKKLFAGDSDLAVLKLIESCQTHVKPPSTLNPKVPKELDYLILRTLAKQREKRFQTAEEMQRAFHKFLYSYAPDFNPTDLAYYAKELFKHEIVEDRKKIQKLNDKVEQLLASELETPNTTLAQRKAPGEEHTSVSEKRRTPPSSSISRDQRANPNSRVGHESAAQPAYNAHDSQNTQGHQHTQSRPQVGRPEYSHPQASRSTGRTAPPQKSSQQIKSGGGNSKYLIIGTAALLMLSLFGPEFGMSIPILSDLLTDWTGGSEARVQLHGNYKDVTVAVNGQGVASTVPTTLKGIPVGTPFRLTVKGTGGEFQEELTLKKGEQKVVVVTLSTEQRNLGSVDNSSSTNSKGNIQLELHISPKGGEVKIALNGQPIDPNNPSTTVELDKPLTLIIEHSDYKVFKSEFYIPSHQVKGLTKWVREIELEPKSFGYVTLHTTPSADALLNIHGSEWKKKTPIEREKIPVGQYTLKFKNDVLGMEKSMTIDIMPGRVTNIDTRLEIKN